MRWIIVASHVLFEVVEEKLKLGHDISNDSFSNIGGIFKL